MRELEKTVDRLLRDDARNAGAIRYAVLAEWLMNQRLRCSAPFSDHACHSTAEPANVSRLGHDGIGRREGRHSIQMRSVLRYDS